MRPKKNINKDYKSLTKNSEFIESHNAKSDVTFTVRMNVFGDLTMEERKQMLKLSGMTSKSYRYKNRASNSGTPSSWDWRQKGVVGPVHDQGQCGSAVIYVGVDAAQSACAIQNGEFVQLSIQQVIDCDPTGQGCNGETFESVFAYIVEFGLEPAASYPDGQGTCQYNASAVVCQVSAWKTIPAGDEAAMEDAIGNICPVAAGIDASQSSFMFYSSGIYSDPNCNPNDLDHALLVVGYGTSGSDYWIAQNSWGTSWGEQGYMRILKNGKNTCGIASYSSYPLAL